MRTIRSCVAMGVARSACASLLLFYLVLSSANAMAGNRYTYHVGGRAAGMAGAFTALADDGSAAYYNPAALSLSERHSMDLSASAYALQLLDIAGMVRTRAAGTTHDANLAIRAIQIVPTSLNVVYRLSAPETATRHVLALSVLVPADQDLEASFGFDLEPLEYGQKLRVRDRRTLYRLGPSYGVRVNDTLSLGGALFAAYGRFNETAQLHFHRALRADGVPQDSFFLAHHVVDGTALGLGLSGAILLRFGHFRIGAVIETPIFEIYSKMKTTGTEAAVFPGEGPGAQPVSAFADETTSTSQWTFKDSGPALLRAGFGYELPGRFRAGVDIAWHTAFSDSASGIHLRHTVNVAVGAEVFVTPTVPIAVGFFTDFHPESRLTLFGAQRANYYGGTFAVSFVSPYDVVGSPKTDRITFATTVGLHYAYGKGRAMGLLIDLDDGFTEDIVRPLCAHDVHLFVGSTVRF